MAWPFSTTSSDRRSYSPARSTYSHRSSRSHNTSGTSYYKRSPRRNYVSRLIQKLKHMLREIYYYARRHPAKVFFLVVMPLVTSGAFATIAKVAGISLPAFLMGKKASSRSSGGGYYGSKGYSAESEYGGMAGGIGAIAQGMSGGGMMSAIKLAKNFM